MKAQDQLEIKPDTAIAQNRCYEQPFIRLYNKCCIEGIKDIQDNSINTILTDPPYLYLKNQKLERDFDEKKLFQEWKRVLKDDGFVIIFGRGTSFYRWNTILDSLGFIFKEEIIWNKSHSSSPLMSLSRVHESIAIYTKKSGKINKIKVPYLQMKQNDLDGIITDIKRLKTVFQNAKSLDAVNDFIISKKLINIDLAYRSTTVTSEKIGKPDRCVSVINSIENGMTEKSIMEEIRDHYTAIHPTQKPEALLKRLLKLTSKKSDTILDCFSGSCSTGIAASNLEMNFIGFEIDEEYFDLSIERLKSNEVQLGFF
jgi:site-specific DNA-methyltransferase (adenine-specific)